MMMNFRSYDGYLEEYQRQMREYADAHRLAWAIQRAKRSTLPDKLGHIGRRIIQQGTSQQNLWSNSQRESS